MQRPACIYLPELVNFRGAGGAGQPSRRGTKTRNDMIAIGIDPGVNTGLAVWDADAQQFAEVTTTTIVAAMDIVLHYASQGRAVTLYAEDARQRKWIPREASISQFKGRAMGAGSVKRDCSIWEECSQRFSYFFCEALSPPCS